MRASISLPNFKNEFDRNVKKELRKEISARMPVFIQSLKEKLKIELVDAISASPTWRSVKGGALRGELGLFNTASIDNILYTWAEGIEVVYEKNKDLGIIRIGMIQMDYSDVLSLSESSFIAVSQKSGRSSVVEWLRWLLLESTQVIVADYSFYEKLGGRTGLGIMIKTGRGWQIPPEHAGSATDNFATRSLQDIGNVIDRVVEVEVKRRF